jgi:hypothetical protein
MLLDFGSAYDTYWFDVCCDTEVFVMDERSGSRFSHAQTDIDI